MSLTIYHNPRCSKSRKTLEIIREQGVEPKIVQYLKDPPTPSAVLQLASLLGLPVRGLLRTAEDDYRNAGSQLQLDDDDAVAKFVSEHPKVLQRPIVVDAGTGRAVIGRPPANVMKLIGK